MNDSISIANPKTDILQKVGLLLAGTSVLILLITWAGVTLDSSIFLPISLMGILIGTSIYSFQKYKNLPAGIKNNGVYQTSLTNRGAIGWVVGIVLTGFYIFLYWFPEMLGQSKEGNTGIVALFDPLSIFFKSQAATQWFMYGTLYTLIIISLGVKFMLKYRHNRYQLIRTIVVVISQLFLAYLIPEIMEGMNSDSPYFAKDLKNMWPLNYYFFEPWHLKNMQASSSGMIFLVWGILLFAVVTPIITYFAGKRWYCSWVCGCGGLAETAGDPFRHLSSKKLSVWKNERWMIHLIMVFIFVVTAVTLYGYFAGTGQIFGMSIGSTFRKPYAFLIGAMFSGVIGVGFYPLLGNRVWCRFGCPLAGYMGLIQRFKSRFRITTNGGQCISCGNCSTYCEQGIDVRWYAQRGENIVRSSCVGCGICSAVCPRGVLKLENGPKKGRNSV
ncbi:MAG: 4Fe-4S binding protein [Cytophagales bacterium]|nr:4Fe-4S binding protein [Cytophagales bacterium]